MKRMIDDSVLTDIADAIREKNGTDTKYEDVEMAQAVMDISSPKEEQEKTVEITENGVTEILPDENKALSKVIVNVNVEGGDEVFFASSGRMYKAVLTFPENVTRIDAAAFNSCFELIEVDISKNVTSIGDVAFYYCISLRKVIIRGAESLGAECFNESTAIQELYLPNTLKKIVYSRPLFKSPRLEFVTLEENFNCDRLSLSSSTRYSRETIVSWFKALADRTGLETYTLTIGATNLAKLTENDIAIATNKNWTIA